MLCHPQSFYLSRLNAARCAIRAFSFEPGHSDLAFIMHSSCRLSSFDAVAQLPNTALAEARVAAGVFSPVSPLRCGALRLETGEGVVPLLASAYSCIFYSNVRGSGPCCACFALFTALGIPRAALSLADIACAPWRFHFLFQAPFLKLRTLLGRKKGGFLFVLRKPNILQCSAGGS